MAQISGEARWQNTRRWQRHQVDLPVRIIGLNGILTTPVPARGSEISRAGMALRAKIALKPGDMMQLQFPTSTPSRVTAVVRNRTGDYLGLEFLSQLPPDTEATDGSQTAMSAVLPGSSEVLRPGRKRCSPASLQEGLRRKQEELKQLKREIEALKVAIVLLADDGKEPSRPPVTERPKPDTRAWPIRP